MYKIITIFIIISLFSGFSLFNHLRKSEKSVLNIITPTTIQVDLNNNKIPDNGETICIPEIETFSANLSINQTELSKKLNVSSEDSLKLGYLTDQFADNFLSDKMVNIKFTGQENQNCKFADIYQNKVSYREKLISSGLSSINFDFKQLEKAKKLNLAIINHKSNKYHTLDCKYGLVAHDAIIIPTKQLPKDAKPCKFCHVPKEEKATQKPITETYPLVISNGSIKMFLTDLTTKLKPDDKCTSLACKEVLNQINSAQESIDIALYGWSNVPEIYNALKNAKSRNVKIRIVYNSSTKDYYPETSNLVALADKSSTDTPKILMHNKFMIFDNKRVITGSMNFAPTGFSGFNSNCILFINSVEIAKIFSEEFNQMLNGKFHSEKVRVNHKTVQLGSAKVTPFFSPKDKAIVNAVIPLVNNAKHYIFIPAFIITHEGLSNALIEAKKRNVNIKIIIDATNPAAAKSKIKLLRASGIQVKTENYAGKIHSKSIIIDDKYIIAGSMNFSNSGENRNDENCLIIEDERLARYYRGFFEYLWAKIPDKYLKINPRPEGKTSIGSCSDGIDNNYDGKIDLEDAACR